MSIFDSVLSKKVKSSKFDLSYDNKLSCSFGDLVPVLCQETLPGDSFRHSHEIFAQFAPMNSLMMHHFDIKVEYFHVPNRLLWSDFEKFLVGGEDGKTVFSPPSASYGTVQSASLTSFFGVRSLADYLGFPTNPQTWPVSSAGGAFSLLPFRAYQLIYNDFYRDENLIQDLNLAKSGGLYYGSSPADVAELTKLFTLRKRAWKKDYFTSALPWPQKGEEVTLPISGEVYAKQGDGSTSLGATTPIYGVTAPTGEVIMDENGNYVGRTRFSTNSSSDQTTPDDDADMVNFFLSEANIGTINDLRTAEVVQEWLEKNARGGTRYIENIFSHFGVRVPDYRLDRPEFIGSARQPFVVGNVYSTNSSTPQSGSGDNIQGYPVATASSSQHGAGWKYKVKEHGWLIGIMSVQPKAAYFQGLPKKFTRFDKFDYYWPEFANLGEQEIKNSELYLGTDFGSDGVSNNVKTFGYTPRYAEYKHNTDEVHGDYRDSLNFFHDARIFSSRPTLSQSFIEVRPSESQLNRIFNYQLSDYDKVYVDIYHHLSAVRKMPYFGIPKFM